MKFLDIAALVMLFSVLSGCADTHQLLRIDNDASVRLNQNGSIYVAAPKDGIYGNNNYHGSGANTAQIIRASFSRQTRNVEVAREYEQFNKALEYAKNNGFQYLVFPTILHWEDRATEWSSIPDQVEVKIDIIDTARGKTVAAGIVKGKSGIATFGGDHPQDLLPKPIDEFITSLY